MRHVLFVVAAMLVAPVYAQGKAPEKPFDTMQVLREKLKGDKKLLVAANMGLTEPEAKAFWPIYEDYQKGLHKINDRLATAVVAYSREYNAKSLTDDKARKLLDEALAVEEAEIKLKRSFMPRLTQVLPGIKVARYMQIENKIRAIVKYEIAAEVPLVR